MYLAHLMEAVNLRPRICWPAGIRIQQSYYVVYFALFCSECATEDKTVFAQLIIYVT